MEKDDDKGRTMVWWNVRDEEDGDPFASATGTFVVNLFDRDCDERSNMTHRAAEKETRRRKKTAAGRDGGR